LTFELFFCAFLDLFKFFVRKVELGKPAATANYNPGKDKDWFRCQPVQARKMEAHFSDQLNDVGRGA
jgi:hypothetical protein